MLSLHLSWAKIPPAAPLGGSGSASLLRGIPGRTDRKASSAGGLPPRMQIRPLSFRRKRGLGQPGTPAPPGDSLPPGGFTGVLGTRCPPRCSGARESEYETRKVRPKLPTCGQPVKPFSSRALRSFSQYEIPLAGCWPAPPKHRCFHTNPRPGPPGTRTPIPSRISRHGQPARPPRRLERDERRGPRYWVAVQEQRRVTTEGPADSPTRPSGPRPPGADGRRNPP